MLSYSEENLFFLDMAVNVNFFFEGKIILVVKQEEENEKDFRGLKCWSSKMENVILKWGNPKSKLYGNSMVRVTSEQCL